MTIQNFDVIGNKMDITSTNDNVKHANDTVDIDDNETVSVDKLRGLGNDVLVVDEFDSVETDQTEETMEEPTTVENVEVLPMGDDFFTEAERKQVAYLAAKSERSKMVAMMDSLTREKYSILPEDEFTNTLVERVANLDKNDIKRLTDGEIEEIYTIDSKLVDIPDLPKDRANSFRRDFLVFLKENADAEKKYQEAYDELNNTISELEDQLEDHEDVIDMENISDFYRKRLALKIEQTEGDVQRKFVEQLAMFEDSFKLGFLEDFIRNPKNKNHLFTYTNNKASMKIYNKYLENKEILKLSTDFTSIPDLEKVFEDPKYTKRMNLFLFTAIAYVASLRENELTPNQTIMLSQFAINAKYLSSGTLMETDDMREFAASVIRILDYFY